MEANELRIGNYVFAPNGEVCKVGYEVIRVLVIIDPKPSFTPIPLTEEWLERFGLRDSFGCFSFNFIDMELSIHKSYNIWRITFEKVNRQLKIKHVHQLQNLYFALTGKELTIK